MHAKAQASNRMAKANTASHGPRVRAKEIVKKTRKNPKQNPKEPKVRSKVPKAHTRAKHRELVSQVFNTRNRKQARKVRNQCKWDRFIPLTRRGFMT